MLEYSKLKENFEYPDAKEVEFQGEQLFIKQYLPVEEKYGLIYICLESLNLEDQAWNPLTSELLFDLQIIKSYTNVNFNDSNDSYFKEYDILQLSGLINLVIENIPQEEYEELQRLYDASIKAKQRYVNNLAFNISKVFTNIPDLTKDLDHLTNMEGELKILDNLPQNIQEGIKTIEKLSNDDHI